MRFILTSVLAGTVILSSCVVALDGDQQQALDLHNQARAGKGVPGLWWDEGLARDAQDWANYLRGVGGLEHSTGGGENLYWQPWTSGDSLAQASQAWINEASNYWGQAIGEGDFMSYGHYTQVMWRNTQRVGIAVADDGRGGQFVVARYDPVGNYEGERPY